MGDDWEDWENFTPAPAAVVEAPKPAGSGLAADVDMSKFKDEEKDALEDPKYVVPASQVGHHAAGTTEDEALGALQQVRAVWP